MFRRRKPYRKYFFLLFFAGILVSLWMIDVRIRSTLYEMARVRAVQLATEAINNAVRMKVAEEGTLYSDLIKVHKDTEGRVVLMQANTAKINQIASETTLAVQAALLRLGEESLYIPAGQITGISMLASLGPKIRIDIIPIGTVQMNVDDRFDQAGINQTRHSIYLDYDTEVRVVVPLKSGLADVTTQVPIAESIIIGEVPSTFVSLPGGLFGAGMGK